MTKRELTFRKAKGKDLFVKRLKGELASNEFGYIPNEKFFLSWFISQLKHQKYIKNNDSSPFRLIVLKDFIYDDHRSGETSMLFCQGDEIIVDMDFIFWL